MKPLRLVALCVSTFAALLSSGYAQVNASLVAAETSIQPGRPFTVALRLVHEAHWHTYWLNPGTGLATKLVWKLPDGFKAGEIQWPAPHVLQDATGTVTGSGYDGELFLPVEITPPATLTPGDRITLAASASWLMCADVCKPGSAAVQLTLPVSADVPHPDPQWSANAVPSASGAIRLDHDRHPRRENRPADGETRRPGRIHTDKPAFFLRGQLHRLRAAAGGEA